LAEDVFAEIKKHLGDGKLILGTKLTLKSLKLGNLEKVFVTSNCPASVKSDVDYYAGTGNCKAVALDIPNDELGVICKKQFSVSIAGLLKQ
jgi:large subunit ribosomal protein L30e